MWSPTHVLVIVRSAENLLIKGKNGTNNAFVLIKLGDDIYKTSTRENSGKSVTWNEECELKIPDSGNKASVVLKVMHKNHLGVNQLIGIARIPLSSFEKEERSTEWLKLEGRQQKGNDKFRGILEVEIGFVVREEKSQSLSSSLIKEKFSVERLTGSLFGLNQGEKKLKLKTIATSLQKTIVRKKRKSEHLDTIKASEEEFSKNGNDLSTFDGNITNLDPGVISDDEEDPSQLNGSIINSHTDKLSASNTYVSSNSLGSHHHPDTPKISISLCDENNSSHHSSLTEVGSQITLPEKENQVLLPDKTFSTSCVDIHLLSQNAKSEKNFSSLLHLEADLFEPSVKFSKLARKFKSFQSIDKKEVKRTVIGCEANDKYDENGTSKSDFRNKNKDELIRMVMDLQKKVNCITLRVKDLEDYLDIILLKVMENFPKLLEKS